MTERHCYCDIDMCLFVCVCLVVQVPVTFICGKDDWMDPLL